MTTAVNADAHGHLRSTTAVTAAVLGYVDRGRDRGRGRVVTAIVSTVATADVTADLIANVIEVFVTLFMLLVENTPLSYPRSCVRVAAIPSYPQVRLVLENVILRGPTWT